LSVVLPDHKDLSIYHNWQKNQGLTVEELFEDEASYKEEEWDSLLAFQKAKATDEMWSMHWFLDAPEDWHKAAMHPDERNMHSLYAPTFKDLMKLMLTKSVGQLIDYE
jgi:hypothetical protein